MKSKDKILVSAAALMIALVNLASCTAPTPEVITEKIIETVLVEKEGQTVVETVEVDKIVTVTPVPTESDEVDPVTVTIYVGFGTGTHPDQQAVHAEMQELYNNTHDTIQIEFLYVGWEERITKFTTLLAAGTPPDIAMPIGVGGIAEFYRGWADLTLFLQEDQYDMSRFAGKTGEIHNYPGQGVLGLPLCVYPSAIFYNADFFDAAGVDYPPHHRGEPYADGDPWTYDKLFEIARLLTLDANGNNANSPAFDPKNIVQYGWSGWDWANIGDFTVHFGDEPGTGVSLDGRTAMLTSPSGSPLSRLCGTISGWITSRPMESRSRPFTKTRVSQWTAAWWGCGK